MNFKNETGKTVTMKNSVGLLFTVKNGEEIVFDEKIALSHGLVKVVGKSKVKLDLNGDGVVDKKDSSIAGKVLAYAKKNKSKKVKK